MINISTGFGSWWWTGKPGMLHAVHGVAKSWTQLSDWTELNVKLMRASLWILNNWFSLLCFIAIVHSLILIWILYPEKLCPFYVFRGCNVHRYHWFYKYLVKEKTSKHSDIPYFSISKMSFDYKWSCSVMSNFLRLHGL